MNQVLARISDRMLALVAPRVNAAAMENCHWSGQYYCGANCSSMAKYQERCCPSVGCHWVYVGCKCAI